MSRYITADRYCVNCGKSDTDMVYGCWICNDCLTQGQKDGSIQKMVSIVNHKFNQLTGKRLKEKKGDIQNV